VAAKDGEVLTGEILTDASLRWFYDSSSQKAYLRGIRKPAWRVHIGVRL